MALKKFGNNEVVLDSLYVDSTFLSRNYAQFPMQKESIACIITLIEKWFAAHDKNIVIFRPPASVGYEHLLVEISRHFQQKIHLSGLVYKDYLHIPEYDVHFDNDAYSCGRIHLCGNGEAMNKWFSKKSVCSPDVKEEHVCIIRPTAMRWHNFTKNSQCYVAHEEIKNVYFVCYSNHSSFNEIKDLIDYLKPKTIKLNVIPKTTEERNEMYSVLDDITKELHVHQPLELDKNENGASKSNERCFQRILAAATQNQSMVKIEDDISNIRIKRRRKQ